MKTWLISFTYEDGKNARLLMDVEEDFRVSTRDEFIALEDWIESNHNMRAVCIHSIDKFPLG